MKIEISKDRVKLIPENVNEIYEIGAFMERIRTLMRKHNSKETISTEYSCDDKCSLILSVHLINKGISY